MRLTPITQSPTPSATSERARTTGFEENWSAALGLALSEDLPVTSRFLPTMVSTQRKKRVKEYLDSGDIPYATAVSYGGDTDGLALHARDVLGLEGFVTDEEYEEKRKLEYKGRRDYSQSVFEKADKYGVVGRMAGNMHAMALDPIYAASMLTGYGSAATAGQAIIRTMAIEGAVEAIAQVPKMSFKEDIESEHSGARALTEIAFASIGAGALVGLGKGLGKMLTPKDLTVGQAIEVLEKIAKESPEVEVIMNTVRHADPEDNLAKLLEADEAIDIRRATEGPLRLDEKANSPMETAEYDKIAEEVFEKRQPIEMTPEKEGVPRGTPTEAEPDLRHPMVVEADNAVHKIDDAIKIMEECF